MSLQLLLFILGHLQRKNIRRDLIMLSEINCTYMYNASNKYTYYHYFELKLSTRDRNKQIWYFYTYSNVHNSGCCKGHFIQSFLIAHHAERSNYSAFPFFLLNFEISILLNCLNVFTTQETLTIYFGYIVHKCLCKTILSLSYHGID